MSEGNDKYHNDEIFSKAVRAGKRTYFFDVKATRGNDLYLTITESKRKYNEDGVVWVSGSYGNEFRKNVTWLSKLISPSYSLEALPVANIKIYPNPSVDELIYVSFKISESIHLRISIYDINGKLLKVLLADKFEKGNNILSFSPRSLRGGTYIVTFEDSNNNSIICSEKIVVL